MKSDFKKIKLNNGLRILLVSKPSSMAITVMIMVQAGSKYETKNISGVSHFLEHMCFKGTKNRPRAIDIASELDGLGAHYNAFTSQEFTSYFVKSRNGLLEKTFNVVSDIYLNSLFNAEEIEKEKGVILEEINMYEDIPSKKIHSLFMELVYGDQPAGWDIAGNKEVIKKLKRDDFLGYHKSHYLPQSTVVVVAGAFEEKTALTLIENSFSNLAQNKKSDKLKVKDLQEKPEELVRFKESDQTHLVMGVRAFSIFDKRRFALNVLADILGGGMSSRLFQKIREEMGAAYYVYASPDLYSDHGLLLMSAGVDHNKIEEVVKAVMHEFSHFKEKLVSAEELKRAKEHIIGTFFLSLETSDELGSFYGAQEISGLEFLTPLELADKIQEVSAEDIQKTAQEIFRESRLNLALIGPFKNRSFKHILRFHE